MLTHLDGYAASTVITYLQAEWTFFLCLKDSARFFWISRGTQSLPVQRAGEGDQAVAQFGRDDYHS